MSRRQIDAKELSDLAGILKVISHPIRLRVLELLEEHQQLYVSQMLEEIEVEQSLLSHHLTKLRSKGVLSSERVGRNILYSLKFKEISKIFDCMENCSIV